MGKGELAEDQIWVHLHLPVEWPYRKAFAKVAVPLDKQVKFLRKTVLDRCWKQDLVLEGLIKPQQERVCTNIYYY